jgi:hypothetical protein
MCAHMYVLNFVASITTQYIDVQKKKKKPHVLYCEPHFLYYGLRLADTIFSPLSLSGV